MALGRRMIDTVRDVVLVTLVGIAWLACAVVYAVV
jgi:hypothetical protein